MKSKQSKSVIVLHPHKKDCDAVKHCKEKFWNTPWAFLDHVSYRDSIGRKNAQGAHIRWWYVRCNSLDCKADILVNENSILENLKI